MFDSRSFEIIVLTRTRSHGMQRVSPLLLVILCPCRQHVNLLSLIFEEMDQFA